LRYPAAGNFAFNVVDQNNEFPAVFMYVGEVSESRARERLSDVSETLRDERSRLVVWYREGGALKCVHPENLDTFDVDPHDLPNHITFGDIR
jgi:hypothetical protein